MRGLVCVVALFIINVVGNAAARSKSKMHNHPIKLYYLPASSSCRSVIMAAKVMGVELELTNIMEGQQMTPEYLKMNPQHMIPTMDDNGFILWENRAIMAYLANTNSSDDTLYPKNPRLRAIVDERLYFDIGTLYARYSDLYLPLLNDIEEYNEEKAAKLDEALGWLNSFLDGKAFVAGDDLTIADISIIVTITNLDAFGYDMSAHENLTKWFERTKVALEPYGYNEVDAAGAIEMSLFLKKD